ncbi:MAG TPA: DMT family transporter [Steroidobacteraceae bacterium]|nr:DMT family transporter [Steroidobacteraceae bacterium]
MSRRAWAIASVILLMVLWGTTFVVTKEAVREVPPLTLGFLRFFIAALVLLPIAFARGGLATLPRPLPLARLVWMGIAGIAVFSISFNYAMSYASASQGALIFALVPAAVLIAAMVGLGERPSRRRIVGIVLSICGVAIVVVAGKTGGSASHPVLGAFWMLVAVVAWAFYTVLAKKLEQADQIVVIALVSLVSLVLLLPAAAFEVARFGLPEPSPAGWLGTLFLGLFASALAYVWYSRALQQLDASVVGVYLNLDPIVGVITAVLFLGETLNGLQIAGGIAAFAGMWLASTRD